MKIRVISIKEEIGSPSKCEKIIHLAFRPSYKDIYALVQACPNMRALQLPISYFETVSSSTKLFLEMKGIALLEGDVWDQRRHINEYSEIQTSVFDKVNKLKSEGLSEPDMLDRLGEETHLSKDMLKFLLKKKAKKDK